MSYQSEWLNVTHPRTAREEPTAHPWQTVRKRYWWREERRKTCTVPRRERSAARSQIFEEKTFGHCFNCLARDHRVAQCRDPPRRWKCKASSHISSRCKSKASSSPGPAASAQPQLKYRPIFLSQTKPACSEMERRRSLGSAPTDTRSYRDGGAQFKIEDAGLRVKSVINFSGNPRFKPRVAFKLAATSWKMEDMNHQGRGADGPPFM
jgi:hypothetical protein